MLHQNKEIFGPDADEYRPERWLESEGADPAKLSRMRQSMFQFGAGSRTCIGKNISLMETYKMIATFLRSFEVRIYLNSRLSKRGDEMTDAQIVQVELTEPEARMYLKNAFFVHRKNFNVHIKLRNKSGSN